MRRLVGSGVALVAGLVCVEAGACTSSDAGTPASTGGAGTSGGDASVSGGATSGGAPASGGVDSGGAPASGGTGGSGGISSESGAGGSGTAGKLTCVAPRKNTTVGNPCPGTAPPALKLTQIVTDLVYPTFVAQAPGDPDRLYVVEQQTGLMRTVKDGAIESTPFLNIKSALGGAGLSGEQGFLGLAFDPNYETSRRFFVKYSGTQGKHVIAEYKVGTDGVADPASARIILEFNHPHSTGNHNGGMVAVGPDGCLYVAVGDGGGSNDELGNGQRTSDYFGSILRLDVDNFPTPAPGNMRAPANPHLWNYGLRNPWRFSFDTANGDIYIGDVGQGAWEEIDVEPRGAVGRNYGWSVMEGAHCFSGSACDQSGITLPAAEYVNPGGEDSYAVAGGYVYRGTKIPGMTGRYIYTDTFKKKISSFVYKGETDGKPEICDAAELTGLGEMASGDIVSFGQDLAGEVYVVTQVFDGPGSVYRIDPAD